MTVSMEEQPSDARKAIKPALSFESITFSDGQTLTFEEDEIIVFVGPNNAGKSAALKELQEHIATPASRIITTSTTLRRTGTSDDLKAYLEENAQKMGGSIEYRYGGIGFNIHKSHIAQYDGADLRQVAPFFSGLLATETRITGSNPAGAIALHQDPPSHSIHLLMMDQALAEKFDKLFRRAFNNDLTVFRAGGSQFPLYVGQKPIRAPGVDELDKGFVYDLISSCIPLQSQGDGMRSFCTVMLNVLAAANHSVQFLDEPEAFLHPPQARLLGEYIAGQRESTSQLFIATHSTDILDGLVAGGAKKVRIIRIQREGNINRVKELSKEKTAEIASDALTRYSRVFEGIFYEHVIIAESDSDCMFYSAILHTKAVSHTHHPDVLFIHAAGKHRMAKLAETLRSLDVPISVIADIDILSEKDAFRQLFEKVGGQWSDIADHWQAIHSSITSQRPPLNAEQVKTLISDELKGIEALAPFPKTAERNIKRIFKSLSEWDAVKQSGRSALRGAQAVNHFDELVRKCSDRGLWIVPVGELEGFCRTIEAAHGPAFVEKVLEDRDLEADPELQEARNFVSAIWSAAKAGLARLTPAEPRS